MSWNDVRQRVSCHEQGDSTTWCSERKGLLHVIDVAEAWGIDSQWAEQATITNLKTILSECKRAIRYKNPDQLLGLFTLAATYRTWELRDALRLNETEEIPVERVDGHYNVRVTPQQLERIKSSTRTWYEYNQPVIHEESRYEPEPVWEEYQ